jgi:hypothetical protein
VGARGQAVDRHGPAEPENGFSMLVSIR